MRVLVGMSGGVDSTTSAFLLKQMGHEPVGINLVLNGDSSSAAGAERCAEYLDIEFHAVDMSDEFARRVKTPFAESYLSGETPNPCIICNREIKFGLMMELMEKYGCEKLATGHYVGSEYSEKYGQYVLKKGVDPGKDQSYFLWEIDSDRLSKTVFPLAGLIKPQVREIAQAQGLPCAHSPESQDVCFIPDGNCAAFIARFTGKKPAPGKFIDTTGKVLGTHRGIAAYTVGQRKGLGISAEHPLYVLRKDGVENTVLLGKNEELFSDTVYLRSVRLITGESRCRVQAKIRYSVTTHPAELVVKDGFGVLKFDVPQRAPTPGQSAVFYDGDTVLGGGFITETEADGVI